MSVVSFSQERRVEIGRKLSPRGESTTGWRCQTGICLCPAQRSLRVVRPFFAKASEGAFLRLRKEMHWRRWRDWCPHESVHRRQLFRIVRVYEAPVRGVDGPSCLAGQYARSRFAPRTGIASLHLETWGRLGKLGLLGAHDLGDAFEKRGR